MGPSFFSMSYEFKELFEDCKIPNPLELFEINPLYAVHFEGAAKPFHIYKDDLYYPAFVDAIQPSIWASSSTSGIQPDSRTIL